MVYCMSKNFKSVGAENFGIFQNLALQLLRLDAIICFVLWKINIEDYLWFAIRIDDINSHSSSQ